MTSSPPSQGRDANADARGPTLWFRALLPSGSLGPGKLQLIRLIGETGSVSGAAKQLRMSHARSVKLVAEVNALGSRPLIVTRSGGAAGGGASLTEAGRELVALYKQLEAAVEAASAPHLRALDMLLSSADESPSPAILT